MNPSLASVEGGGVVVNAMDTDNKKAVIQKAKFYWQEKLECHVKKVPTGFVNGFIKSDLENETFYWFYDSRNNKLKPEEITQEGWEKQKIERLFLEEIFDIKDYEEEL